MRENDHFGELLGINVLEVKSGYAKISLKITKNHLNFAGFVHGGVIFGLADCAFAEASNFDRPAVAVQVSINYIRPCAEGDTLTAEASRVSEGKTFQLFKVTVTKEEKLVALFSGLAYNVPSDKAT
jgi:acyl-CoA thioesterase